jgi:hypothetical protein
MSVLTCRIGSSGTGFFGSFNRASSVARSASSGDGAQ